MTKNFTLFILSSFTFITTHAQDTQQKIFYHDYDKTQLTNSSQQQLDNWIQQLKSLSLLSVSISSYSDKKGANNYNKQLSEQRSIYVMKVLQAAFSKDVLYKVNHFGKENLISTNDNDQAENRRSIVTITYKKDIPKSITTNEKPVIELTPYTEDVEEQHYNVNLTDSVFITGKDGTQIRFAPGTIQNKTGELITGSATVVLKEYYKPGDILLSGMHSESGNGLLQTSGMFKMIIIKNGDTLAKETKKPVGIKIPDKNNLSIGMNVFTMNHGDTSLWNDTRTMFNYSKSNWDWPNSVGKLKDFFVEKDLPFRRWQTGRKWSEEYNVGELPFSFFRKPDNKALAKYVRYTLTKKDSQTLSVQLSETFRRRGIKQFYTKKFDTTFPVVYAPPYYETTFSDLSFINCDRFLKAPVRTNFYVKTSNFKGPSLLVYFKSLNAFLSVPYNNGKYSIHNVPPDEKVILFAVGKRSEEFYCGKKEFTISKNATTELSVQKTKYEDIKKMMGEVSYAK